MKKHLLIALMAAVTAANVTGCNPNSEDQEKAVQENQSIPDTRKGEFKKSPDKQW